MAGTRPLLQRCKSKSDQTSRIEAKKLGRRKGGERVDLQELGALVVRVNLVVLVRDVLLLQSHPNSLRTGTGG
jgi:hypothetical protein